MLKVSGQTISSGEGQIGTFDKNQGEQQRLQKVQTSNLVTISGGDTENQEESAMADVSPRTDISTDGDFDDKNQQVMFLLAPLYATYSIFIDNITYISHICIFENKSRFYLCL